MSDPATWPRDDHGNVTWGDAAPGILVARLPSAVRCYEPIIVTTLRRYVRRGASEGLLHRIAGSARHFRTLNTVWDLDGRALERSLGWQADDEASPTPDRRREDPRIDELGVVLSTAERRIALFQIIAEYTRAGTMMPTTWRLARVFGVTRSTIDYDIDMLRAQGRITCSVHATRLGRRRVIRLVEEGAAP